MVKCYQIIIAVEDLGQKMVTVNPVAKVFKNAVTNTIKISLYPIKHKTGYLDWLG
jgi:ABC-type dipeptide/oligopeptide/nickel transport system permease component